MQFKPTIQTGFILHSVLKQSPVLTSDIVSTVANVLQREKKGAAKKNGINKILDDVRGVKAFYWHLFGRTTHGSTTYE